MANEAFKAEVIALDVQHQLQKALVYSQLGVINHNFEGQVAFAKSVRVVGVGNVTVFDVDHDTDMPDPEDVPDVDMEMTIDYDIGFNFKVHRRDQAQTKINIMDEDNKAAAYAVADAVDQAIASCYVDASASNLVGSDASPKTPNVTKGDASNVFKLITQCATKLKKSNVPATESKWMIVPAEFSELILNELHDQGASAPGVAEQAVLNGSIGKIGGFNILESNNVPNTDETLYKIMFGTSRAITFASQVDDVRILEMEKKFARKVDGEFIFGRKAVKPDCFGVMTCNFN